MSADVEHAIAEGEGSAPAEKGHRRKSSAAAAGIYTAEMLEEEKKELVISKDSSKLNWKINSSPATTDDKDTLKKLLTTPPVKKIDLRFKTGLHVTARNLKGVTIKDALDAIHKQYKKKPDDELDEPYLAGFYWDPEEYGYGTLGVALKKEGAPPSKKKGNKE